MDFHLTIQCSPYITLCLGPIGMDHVVTNVGHFGCGHFGLGRFGLDISATDVSAMENAKGGRFGQNHKLWVGVCASINVCCIS